MECPRHTNSGRLSRKPCLHRSPASNLYNARFTRDSTGKVRVSGSYGTSAGRNFLQYRFRYGAVNSFRFHCDAHVMAEGSFQHPNQPTLNRLLHWTHCATNWNWNSNRFRSNMRCDRSVRIFNCIDWDR